MDTVSPSKTSAARLTVAGPIFIKRKMFWAERYARVKDQKLFYYESKTDTNPRASLHLLGATLIQNINGRDDLMQLRLRSRSILSLFIKIQNRSFKTKFVNCLLQNIKGSPGTQPQDENSSDLDDTDIFDSNLPDLPPMYQYVFEDKYVTEVAEPGYVRREIYHKRHKDGPQLSAKLTTMMQEGFLLLTGFLLAINSYFMVTVLALLVLFWVFRLKHKKQTKIKETLVVKESIPDVAFILKHKRKQLYRNPHNQIDYHQSHFKGDSRAFLVQTQKQHLKFLWDLSGYGNQTVVTVYYDTNAPELAIKKLGFVIAAVRIEEALKGLTGPKLVKMPSEDTFKEDNVLGRMDTLRKESEMRSSSIISESDGQSPRRNSTSNSGNIQTQMQQKKVSTSVHPSDRVYDKSAPARLLTFDQLGIQYPDLPKDLLQQMMVSRQRFLEHMAFQWPNPDTKNGSTNWIRQHNGVLATRGQTTIKGATAQQIMQYILDIEKRPEYDPQYKMGHIIKDYGILGIVYQRFNGLFPVKGRDFVIILCGEKMAEGCFIIHGKSIPYEYAGDGKCVRGVAISAGFEVKEIEPGLIRVTYMSQPDLCGGLPYVAKYTAAKLQTSVIHKFKEVVQKKFK